MCWWNVVLHREITYRRTALWLQRKKNTATQRVHQMNPSFGLLGISIHTYSGFLSPGNLSVNDWNTLKIHWKTDNNIKLHVYLWAGMIENLLTFTNDLDLSRSEPSKISFRAIFRFLLDKLSPNFYTKLLGSGFFNKSKNILSGLNVWCTRTCYVDHHYAKRRL